MFPDPLLVLGGAALRACSGFAVTPAPVRVSSLPLSPSAAGPRSGFGSAAASPRRLPRGRSSYKVTASLRFRALRSQPRIWAQVIRFPARAEEDSGQSERDALAGRGWERRMCAQGQARAPEESESSLRCHTGRVLGRTPHGVAVQRPGERVFGLLAPGVHEDLCQSGTRAPAEKQRLRDPLARDARRSPSPIKPPARPALSGRRAGPSRGLSAES